MNSRVPTEVERAHRLAAESAQLRERLRHAIAGLHAAIGRTSTSMGQLQTNATERTAPARPPSAPAPRDTSDRAPPAAYAVYLEGGRYTHAKRASAAQRYRQALETNYGSAAAVVEAMRATDPMSRERWDTARAYARWSALAPREYAGEAEFQIRQGAGFSSG